MDLIFAIAYREGVSPVKVSLRKDLPSAGSPEADAILGIDSQAQFKHKAQEEKSEPEA